MQAAGRQIQTDRQTGRVGSAPLLVWAGELAVGPAAGCCEKLLPTPWPPEPCAPLSRLMVSGYCTCRAEQSSRKKEGEREGMRRRGEERS
jgi:hypothetical protein